MIRGDWIDQVPDVEDVDETRRFEEEAILPWLLDERDRESTESSMVEISFCFLALL